MNRNQNKKKRKEQKKQLKISNKIVFSEFSGTFFEKFKLYIKMRI